MWFVVRLDKQLSLIFLWTASLRKWCWEAETEVFQLLKTHLTRFHILYIPAKGSWHKLGHKGVKVRPGGVALQPGDWSCSFTVDGKGWGHPSLHHLLVSLSPGSLILNSTQGCSPSQCRQHFQTSHILLVAPDKAAWCRRWCWCCNGWLTASTSYHVHCLHLNSRQRKPFITTESSTDRLRNVACLNLPGLAMHYSPPSFCHWLPIKGQLQVSSMKHTYFVYLLFHRDRWEQPICRDSAKAVCKCTWKNWCCFAGNCWWQQISI